MSNRLAERPLPAGWEARPLRDVVSRVTRRNDVKNGNVLTISAHNGLVNQEEFFSRRIASTDLSPYFLLERGDFAYNKSYSAGFPVGVIRRLDRYPQGVVSPLYICFKPSSPHVSSDYLDHYFQSGLLDDDIAWIAKEGARNHGLLNVSVGDLFSVTVHVPPFAEQVRIAEILDTADEAIRSTEGLIAKLEKAKQGLLHDLLSRGTKKGDNEIHGYFSSALDMAPKAWQIFPLREFYIERPRNGLYKPPIFHGSGAPMVQMGQVFREGPLDASDASRVRVSAIEYERFGLKQGDLLFGRRSLVFEGAGRCAVVDYVAEPTTFESSLIRIRIDSSRLDPSFVALFLSTPAATRDRRRYVRQVAVSGVTSGDVGNFLVAVPSLAKQREILDALGSYSSVIRESVSSLAKLRLLKNGLDG